MPVTRDLGNNIEFDLDTPVASCDKLETSNSVSFGRGSACLDKKVLSADGSSK